MFLEWGRDLNDPLGQCATALTSEQPAHVTSCSPPSLLETAGTCTSATRRELPGGFETGWGVKAVQIANFGTNINSIYQLPTALEVCANKARYRYGATYPIHGLVSLVQTKLID